MHDEIPPTIPRVLARAAHRFGDAPAIIDGAQRLTFRELQEQALSTSSAFMAAGIVPGDRVAIWAPNSAQWVVAALGILGCGGVLVPLNTRLKGKEAGFILRRSGARALVTVGEFLGTRYPALLSDESLPQLERTILIGDTAGTTGATTHSFSEFLAANATRTRLEAAAAHGRVAAGDIADILFTSGTTGQPKGVLSSHEQDVHVFHTWSEFVGLTEADRYLAVNPFFHSFGYKAGCSPACCRERLSTRWRSLMPAGRWTASSASASACFPGRRRSTRACSRTRACRAATCRRCASR